jgi:hypothetical protein
MKEFARKVMEFLITHGGEIYYAMLFAVVLILVISAIRAHKARGNFSYMKAEKPVSSKEYFHAAFAANEYVDDEDYVNYRNQFNEVEVDEDTLTRWEYLAEVYCPKLIKGCIWSLALMAVVAAPYLVIEYFV